METKTITKGYKKTEIGLIPEDWELKTLASITNTITCGVAATPQYVDSSIGKPFLSASHVQKGKVIFDNYKYIPINLFKLITKNNPPQKGDILYTRVGAGIGEAGVIEVEDDFGVYVSLTLIKPKKQINSYFLKNLLNSTYYRSLAKRDQYAGAGVQNLNVQVVREFLIPLPPTKVEQEDIAEALNDADALIESLEKLIVKKRHLKQGAMQELLIGKKRLPGFSGGWEVKKLGDVLTIAHGKSQHDVADRNGIYPILATGGQIGTANRFLYDKPSVLIGRKGTIDQPQFMDTPFWTVDTLFYSVIHEPNNAKFLFYRSCLIDWKQHNEASGVPSLNARTLERIEIKIPEHEEQTAIAAILTDMDAEIKTLEDKLAKAHQVKQGMMQELLTGRIRLI